MGIGPKVSFILYFCIPHFTLTSTIIFVHFIKAFYSQGLKTKRNSRKNSKAEGDHIDYVSEDKYDDHIYDFLDDPMDGKMMMGGQSASKISFSTKSGEDFDEVIRFAYERPWMMKGEFPASR